MRGRGRVNDHPGRFVEDDHIVIFVENIQSQRLRFHYRVSRRGIRPVISSLACSR